MSALDLVAECPSAAPPPPSASAPDDAAPLPSASEPDDTAPLLAGGDEQRRERPYIVFELIGRVLASMTRAEYDALSPLARRLVDFCGVVRKDD
jgi:hypothetical protein